MYNKSRFSAGRSAINTPRASRDASDVARNPAKLGKANVDNEGGLRRAKADGTAALGPTGNDGFFDPIPILGTAARALVLPSSSPSEANADSKWDTKLDVKIDCGTREGVTSFGQFVHSKSPKICKGDRERGHTFT